MSEFGLNSNSSNSKTCAMWEIMSQLVPQSNCNPLGSPIVPQHFKVYSLVVFSLFTKLYNHQHHLIPEYFK